MGNNWRHWAPCRCGKCATCKLNVKTVAKPYVCERCGTAFSRAEIDAFVGKGQHE